jgi:hypothetical protein
VGRDTLADGALSATVDKDGKVRVSVDVNESWCDKPAADIKSFLSPKGADRGDFYNPASLNSKITPEPGIPAPV